MMQYFQLRLKFLGFLNLLTELTCLTLVLGSLL